MIAINIKIATDLISLKKPTITNHITEAKRKLTNFKNKPRKYVTRKGKRKLQVWTLSNGQMDYLDYLIGNLENIVCASKKELDSFKADFDKIIPVSEIVKDKPFKDRIIDLLDYEVLRRDFYPEYFEKLGIKTCVYCNSQLAVTIVDDNGTKVGKFQVDHALPKSEYPCFAISFINLYPVCDYCNRTKNDNPLAFCLYSDDHNDYARSPYRFSLDKQSLVKYRVNGEQEKLKIKFEDSVSCALDKMFGIESIYQTQKDIAEELVIKSMIYNSAYRQSLSDGLRKLFHGKKPMLTRLITGNYVKEADMHRRPMAKFTMDIAKQLGLLKD